MKTTRRTTQCLASILACGAFTFAGTAQASETLSFNRLARWPGYEMGDVKGIHATGSVVWLGIECYHASIGSLIALDVRDPAAPVVLSSTPTGAAAAWAFDNGFAYGVSSSPTANYLEVYDLSDVRRPALRGRASITAAPGWNGGMTVRQGYLWVCHDNGGDTYDVRIPSAPQRAGSLTWAESQPTSRMVLCGSFGVVLTTINTGTAQAPYFLRVLDLNNPATPTEIDSTAIDMGEVGQWPFFALAAVDDVVYYLTGGPPGGGYRVRLRAARITALGRIEPTAVDLGLGQIWTYRIWSVGNHIYFSCTDQEGKYRLHIIDATQHLQPCALASPGFELPSNIWKLLDCGDRVYLSVGGGGGPGFLVALDTTDPAVPVKLATVWESWHPESMAGGFDLVGGSEEPIWRVQDHGTSRVRLFGAAGFLQGKLAPYRDWNLAFDPEWNHLLLHGDYGYALSLVSYPSWTCQLDVFDTSGNGPPVLRESRQIIEENGSWGYLPVFIRHTAKIDRDEFYLGYDPGKLDIYSLQTPASPEFLSQVSIGVPDDLEVHAGYVYLLSATTTGGNTRWLEVVDARDPANPSGATTFQQYTGAWVGRIVIEGGLLYVIYFKNGSPNTTMLDVFDLTDPLSPTRLSSTSVAPVTYYAYNDIAILQPYAILAGPSLMVVDISDPLHPNPLGAYNPFPQLQNYTIASYDRVMTWQNHVIVQNECTGIEILDVARVLSGLNLQPWWGGTLRLSWEGAPGISLQRTPSLYPATWEPVPNTDGQSQATVPFSGSQGYFRLVRP